MTAEPVSRTEARRPEFMRKPYRYVAKQATRISDEIELIDQIQDLQEQEAQVSRVDKEIAQLSRKQTAVIALTCFPLLLVLGIYENSLRTPRTEFELAAIRATANFVFVFLLVKGTFSVSELRAQLTQVADLAALPKLIADFPTKFDDCKQLTIGGHGEIKRIIRLLQRPRAHEIVTPALTQKLIGYCDSVDRLPQIMIKNKEWANKLRLAVEKFVSEFEVGSCV